MSSRNPKYINIPTTFSLKKEHKPKFGTIYLVNYGSMYVKNIWVNCYLPVLYLGIDKRDKTYENGIIFTGDGKYEEVQYFVNSNYLNKFDISQRNSYEITR